MTSAFVFSILSVAGSPSDTVVYTSLEEALVYPEQVRLLSLEGQELTSLPDDIRLLTNLEVLDVSVNNFNGFPEIICELTSLRELYFSGAYGYIDKSYREDFLIDSVPSSISRLENLEILELSYHSISHLPAEFGNLKKLRKLYFYHNYLTESQVSVISQLSDLEVLDIGGNDLNSLPDSFSSLQNLTVLFLDNSWSEGCPVGTTLDEFPMIITKLTKLQTLALSGQYLTKIPEELGDLADLKELLLYANLFRKLPDSITNLEKLETLDIGLLCLGSSLKFCDYRFKFPKEMCRMKSLRSLSFEGRKVMEKDESALRKCLNL